MVVASRTRSKSPKAAPSSSCSSSASPAASRRTFLIRINRLPASADQVLQRAASVARDLGSRPAASYRITKRFLRGPAAERIRAAERDHGDLIDAWAAPATLDAVKQYLERTLRR